MSPNRHYISAALPVADDHTRILKHNDLFAVFDHYGDIRPVGLGEEGIYQNGTRFISSSVFRLGSVRPLFLSSAIQSDNAYLTVDLTNPDMVDNHQRTIPRGSLHLFRIKFLWNGCSYEKLRVRNYASVAVSTSLEWELACDYTDIFEVRGTTRKRRGEHRRSVLSDPHRLTWSYMGLDSEERTTVLHSPSVGLEWNDPDVSFALDLKPGEEKTFVFVFSCIEKNALSVPLPYDEAKTQVELRASQGITGACKISSLNDQFNNWLSRSSHDLKMMATEMQDGPFPYAGIPWFSTPFGRDSLITALECLWIRPEVAKGVLSYLARTQATEKNPERDAEPGKIMHESRGGEMANLGEIPFGMYYGSVDSTPLFVLLAGAYYERTGDIEFIKKIWKNILLALNWIDTSGDLDGDGFVEYFRMSKKGLSHQGWKDSDTPVFHSDGTLAEGPIALCEVQGYVYAAKKKSAILAEQLGDKPLAEKLQAEAETLRERFEEKFWCDDLSTYAIALDGKKNPCRAVTSNAGQLLFSGMIAPERARQVCWTLMSEPNFSGWGIRTISEKEKRYNPMSYHNGSVWPHDNALIAYGFSQYALKSEVVTLFGAMYDAATHMESRIPELMCGMTRMPNKAPTLYPVACSPQAWSAAVVFMLLQSSLGLSIHAKENAIHFNSPVLPFFLPNLTIRNLLVNDHPVDLEVHRRNNRVEIEIVRNPGNIEIRYN